MQMFISHSSKDYDVASKICETLERNGTKCFIAPRDIRLGHEYAQELIDGIDNSFAMLLIMSANANSSPHVLREVERAVSKSIPILVYKIEEVPLSKSMEYFLMTHQWTSADTDENFTDILRFADSIKSQNKKSDSETKGAVIAAGNIADGNTSKNKKRGLFIGLGIGLSALLICVILIFVLNKRFFAPTASSPDGQASSDSLTLVENNTDGSGSEDGTDGQDGIASVTTESPENNGEIEDGNKKDEETEAPDTKNKDKSDKKNKDKNNEKTETPADENNDNDGDDGRIGGYERPGNYNKDEKATPAPVSTDKDTDKDNVQKPKEKTGEKVAVGDTVTFGTYNKEDIEWRVLKISGDGKQAVLVSSKVLCMKAFDSAESGRYNYDDDQDYWKRDSEADTDLELQEYVRGSNIWKNSNLRTWLNTEEEVVKYQDSAPYATAMSEKKNGYQNEPGFLNGFSKEELAAIVKVKNETKSNPLYKSKTISTTDRVYLLSVDELKWFDNAKISKFAFPTDKAIENDESMWWLLDHNEFNIDESVWWLRDPVDGFSSKCYIVDNGYTKNLLREVNAGLEGYGVRPALTVDLQKVKFKKNKK